MDDYEDVYETHCPKCNHSPIRQRDCSGWCDDGYLDEHDDDPINYGPGESLVRCPECKGTGIERWCPNCGEDLSGVKLEWDEE